MLARVACLSDSMGVNSVFVTFEARFDIVTCCDWILRSCACKMPSVINSATIIDTIMEHGKAGVQGRSAAVRNVKAGVQGRSAAVRDVKLMLMIGDSIGMITSG
jgi:hypothetical protein